MTSRFINRLKMAAHCLVKGSPTNQARNSIPVISLSEIQEIKHFFPRPKFFIFGHARSGTTLLARLVRVHPEVHCNWQGHFFTRTPLLESLVKDPEVASWLSRRSNRWNQGKDLSPLVLRGACDLILEREAHQQGKLIVGDKSPNSLLNGQAVQLLANVYPDAKLIYIVRDGRDAVLSHRFQSFIDSTQHLTAEDNKIRQAFIQDPAPFLAGDRSIFTPKGIHKAADGWACNVTETDQAGKQIFKDGYHTLRFEDLTDDPWHEMSKLWDFLDASINLPDLKELLYTEFNQNPDADWQAQKASEIAQPLQKGRSGSWRDMFTPYDRCVFHEIAGETLQKWGYVVE